MNSKECDNPIDGATWRTTWALIVLALPVSLCAAETQQNLRLWPTAVVVRDQVRIGDLCELSGFDAETHERLREMVVVASPPQGGSMVITLSDLRGAIDGAGINMARTIVKGAVECGVTRPRRLWAIPADAVLIAPTPDDQTAAAGRQTLRDAVVAYFEDELSRFGGRVRVDFGSRAGATLDLSGPQFTFAVRRSSGRPLGLIDVTVEVRRQGRPVQQVQLQPIVHFHREVVVARRAINQKAEIRPEDVHLLEMSFERLERLGLADLSQAVGQRAKRFLPAGTVLRGSDLEMVPLVKRGQLVEVYSRVGGISIVTSAKAMETGGLGDLIGLRSSDRKGRILTGLVTGRNRVELRDGVTPAGRTTDRGYALAGANR